MTLKMWIGNLDGSREGLVIAATKARAIEVVCAVTSTSRADFNAYWHPYPVDPTLDPEVLYTRPFGKRVPWAKGRCSL